MGKREAYYKPGDHLLICDRSGLTMRKSDAVREPKTGLVVHKDEVDLPHPQQYRTPVSPDKQSVYPVRPRAFRRTAGSGGELPDGSSSPLPEIQGGAIDDAVSNHSFLDTNDVDPTTF